jgi:hypothetical protein
LYSSADDLIPPEFSPETASYSSVALHSARGAVFSDPLHLLAFFGVWTKDLLLTVMMGNYLIKVGWKAVVTPVTFKVNFLKRAEDEDYYDQKTNFTPFSIEV